MDRRRVNNRGNRELFKRQQSIFESCIKSIWGVLNLVLSAIIPKCFKPRIELAVKNTDSMETKLASYGTGVEVEIHLKNQILDDFGIKEIKYENRYSQFLMEETEKNVIPPTNYKHRYSYLVPKNDKPILSTGLMSSKHLTQEQCIRLEQIKKKMYPNFPTKENYDKFFHYCLWMDEIESEINLRRYNMQGVTMKCVHDNKCLELKVPGLAEKAPSVLNGDIINIRIQNQFYIFQGIVDQVLNTSVYIKSVHQKLFDTISLYPATPLDVGFKVKRLSYERMHEGVFTCSQRTDLLNCLFPEVSTIQWPVFTNLEVNEYSLFNKKIANNPEQKLTVHNILNQTSGTAPYILFGPPGTGKTVTIVEAIMQIKSRRLNSKILVCAPSNAACDMLTSKLIEFGCNQQELVRVHASSRELTAVTEDVQKFSKNIRDPSLLNKYRIIVTTLITSGKFKFNKGFNSQYFPHYLFIDEAAQAMESEAAVAVALLRSFKHIILAGDPKQLGPICQSNSASDFQFDVSMLERLMKNPFYSNYNPNFITMLKLNFRSHPQILKVSNELFYDNSLQAVRVLVDSISVIPIYPKIVRGRYEKCINAATEFCSVITNEKRDDRSTSYYNLEEIDMVENYVTALIKLQEVEVNFEDIGVITPYKRQVQLIKQRLTKCGYKGVEVGCTEVFQGREKRIIIVSTVRARNSLGFVKSAKRFNVALTRAMSKLIVIGCPNVLRSNINWLTYIEFCMRNKSYFGPNLNSRAKRIR